MTNRLWIGVLLLLALFSYAASDCNDATSFVAGNFPFYALCKTLVDATPNRISMSCKTHEKPADLASAMKSYKTGEKGENLLGTGFTQPNVADRIGTVYAANKGIQWFSCFRTTTRNPLFVIHYLLPQQIAWAIARPKDADVKNFEPLGDEVALGTVFENVGSQKYDRGHLAPNSDFSSSVDLMKGTFKLQNMAPQASQLNQQAWRSLECAIRSLVSRRTKYEQYLKDASQRLFIRGTRQFVIVTGTITNKPADGRGYVTTKEKSSKDQQGTKVTVPTRFFKIIKLSADARDAIKISAVNTDAGTIEFLERQAFFTLLKKDPDFARLTFGDDLFGDRKIELDVLMKKEEAKKFTDFNSAASTTVQRNPNNVDPIDDKSVIKTIDVKEYLKFKLEKGSGKCPKRVVAVPPLDMILRKRKLDTTKAASDNKDNDPDADSDTSSKESKGDSKDGKMNDDTDDEDGDTDMTGSKKKSAGKPKAAKQSKADTPVQEPAQKKRKTGK